MYQNWITLFNVYETYDWCNWYFEGNSCPEGYYRPGQVGETSQYPNGTEIEGSGSASEKADCVCFEEDTAYFQNNIKFGDKNFQKSRYDCQQSCAAHHLCQFWTWMKPVQEGHNGACFLKAKRENVGESTRFVSGSKNCPLPEAPGFSSILCKEWGMG